MTLPRQAALAAFLALALLLGLAWQAGTPPAEMLRWYLSLQRPPWQPPDWVVPVAWGVIFALLALALIRALRRAPDHEARRALVHATVLNLFLNGLWAVLFFAQKRPDRALAETLPFWLSVVFLMWLTRRQDRAGPWLLLPYLAWVTFAVFLNRELLRLNGPLP
jgi:tryptophan-rich sensory protein